MAKLLSKRASALALALGIAFVATRGAVNAQTTLNGSPSAIIKFKTTPFIKLNVFPNYNSGFGSVKASTGVQPAAVAGPAASLNGGAVDFGTVIGGAAYLYKYASHLVVTSNASNFAVYAEATANFTQTTDNGNPPAGGATGVTLPVNQTLFYLPSLASGDTNTGYSASRPFEPAASGTFNNPTVGDNGKTYSPIYTGAINTTANLYYDYQLRTQPTASGGFYFLYVVYTVVPI